MGPGLLRHDQHRHLRARAGGAAAHPDGPAVRLLEGALPAAARDGPADVRLRHGRLLAGHRQPRPVPAGELRRARREACASTSPASASAATCGWGRASTCTTSTRSRARRSSATTAAIAPDATVGPYSRARDERDAARARADVAVDHRRVDVDRPLDDGRGRDRRALVRPPRARARARGRRDRRRGDDRLRERDHARRPDLPVQGGRDRLADLREPHLGVARHDAHLPR